MSDEITKDDLKIWMDIQSKATEQTVLIAERLKQIVEYQGKMNEKLTNDISDEICDSVKRAFSDELKRIEEHTKKSADLLSPALDKITDIKINTLSTKEDSRAVKIFVASIAIIIIICNIIFNRLDLGASSKLSEKQIVNTVLETQRQLNTGEIYGKTK